jgi:hypothetical protein
MSEHSESLIMEHGLVMLLIIIIIAMAGVMNSLPRASSVRSHGRGYCENAHYVVNYNVEYLHYIYGPDLV